MIEWLPPFWESVAAGIVAAGIGGIVAYVWKKMRMETPRVAIEGTWAEYVPRSEESQYSVGRISYDRKRGMYAFDGTNYYNNGSKRCHWRTIVSHLDVDGRQFYYIFDAVMEGELDKRYFGFGFVNLVEKDGVLIPADGYYSSASVDSKGMSHSMEPAPFEYSRTGQGHEVIKLLDSLQTPGQEKPRTVVVT